MQKNVLNLNYCQSSVIIPYPLEQMEDAVVVLISFVPEQLEPYLSHLSDLLQTYSHSSMSLIVVCPPEYPELESLILALEKISERSSQLNLVFMNEDLSFQDNIGLIQLANYFIYDSAQEVERLFIAMTLNKKIIYFESSKQELFAKLPSGCAHSLAEATENMSALAVGAENRNIRAITLAHLDSVFLTDPNFKLQIEYINQENADYYLYQSLELADQGNKTQSANLLKIIFKIKLNDWNFDDVIKGIDILISANEYTFALNVVNYLLSSLPESFVLNFFAGKIHQHFRSWQLAIDHFKRALRAKPEHPETQLRLACVREKFNRSQETPPIYFIGMQLTASDYIRDLIAFGLGLSVQHLSSGISNIEYNVLDLIRTRDFAESKGGLAKDHLLALPVNIFILNKLFDKVWVHFRDPRSYLVSSCIYFSELRKRQDNSDISNLSFWWDYGDYFPRENQISSNEFDSLSLSERIDYQLKTGNFEQNWIQMIDQWVKYSQDERFKLEILFTTYEQFKTNEMAFVNQVLDFYEIPRDYFEYPFSEDDLKGSAFGKTPKAGSPNFTLRRGSMTEWKEILSPAQIQQVQNIMPEYMFEMFGWERMHFN